VGDLVKVFSFKKDGLYRAKILKNNKSCHDVFYIDFGNIETVPSNVIYELAEELKKVFFLIFLIYYFIFNDLCFVMIKFSIVFIHYITIV